MPRLIEYNQNMSGQINPNATINDSVLQILAKRLARPVDAQTQSRAALHVLDWFGCAALGAKQSAALGFLSLTASGAEGGCTTLAQSRKDWWYALQLNAALGNMMEMDDLHRSSILHPGPVVLPAAIAVAEMTNASGVALLEALVRGYEATVRIGRALGTTHYRYFHNTSTCGSFGAAAAAASLLKLSPAQTVWALANAGSRTGGLWQMRHEPCETKSLHNVIAAQTGVQAALLAQQGVRGPSTLLEGVQGLFAAMSEHADASRVNDDNEGWLIHDVSFKPWPACRHAHPVIDAVVGLVAANESIVAADIESIDIETYKSAVDFCDKPHPGTELEAKFSLQHCAAVVFSRGRPVLRDFEVSQLGAADLAALRQRVVIRVDDAMTDLFPQHYSARVSVRLKSGAVFTQHQADAWGDPELPLTGGDVIAKAHTLLTAAGVEAAAITPFVNGTVQLAATASVRLWTQTWPQQKSAATMQRAAE
jgi:2-methylcitrate dehydratase PrpD